MIALDTAGLLYLHDPTTKAEQDPATGLPVTDAQARVQQFVSELHGRRERILIPTPALAEFLQIATEEGPNIYARLERSAAFKIEAFDSRAAIELAIITAKAKAGGDVRAGSIASMAKIKFDRQIVAICKVHRVRALFTSDKNLTAFARANGVTVIAIWDLPLPPKPPQMSFWETVKDEAVESQDAKR
ncbi:MAG: hypothetical protein AB7E79_16640 [Rhodospirillaceae bacterium]